MLIVSLQKFLRMGMCQHSHLLRRTKALFIRLTDLLIRAGIEHRSSDERDVVTHPTLSCKGINKTPLI